MWSVGEIRVIAPPSFAEGLLPSLVAIFLERFPRIRVSIDSRSVATTKTMLVTRVVDCAFMQLPVNRDDLIAEPANAPRKRPPITLLHDAK